MAYSLGVDVGTTFTAAAICREGHVEVIALGTHQVTAPSVVFASGTDVAFGLAAIRRGATNPAGLAREFKRRFGDSVPLMLSGTPYSADRLVALYARWVVDTVSEQLGDRPERVVVTHPANWTAFQLNLLGGSLKQADLVGVGLLSEPAAATIDYAAVARVEPGELYVVYDLGGGTFDVALLRKEQDGFTQIGDAEGVERLGGIDFDEAVFQHVLAQVPPEAIERTNADEGGWRAIAQLRQACVDGKEGLSSEVAVDIPVVLADFSSTIRLTRTEFEDMIRPALGQTVDLVLHMLAESHVKPEELTAVLLVGGSSRIPLISDIVASGVGAPVRVDAHPKLVVARGAARWAATNVAAPGGAVVVPPPPRRWWRVGAVVGAVGLLAAGAVGVAKLRDGNNAAADTTTPPTAVTTTTSPTVTTTAPPTTTAVTTAPPATTGLPPGPQVVVVAGTQVWTDTKIDLVPGDKVTITAEGTVYHGWPDVSSGVGPEGNSNPAYDQFSVVKGEPHAALMAKVGDGTPVVIGRGGTFPVVRGGLLSLGVNDGGPDNNRGFFTATVTVVPAGG